MHMSEIPLRVAADVASLSFEEYSMSSASPDCSGSYSAPAWHAALPYREGYFFSAPKRTPWGLAADPVSSCHRYQVLFANLCFCLRNGRTCFYWGAAPPHEKLDIRRACTVNSGMNDKFADLIG
jgi:hypothetical protein